ncbi:anoctamin-7-like [Pristis pectinata]|uniref:anoctamin-7-like n=1 Tax=Pristis pectinata TaxID=685728 RepID=UPI00223DFEF8|nr:anoctamin-7-like [Pristis pectinata]
MTEKIPIIDYVLVYERELGSIDPYAEKRMKFLRDAENTGLRLDHNIAGEKWAAEVMSGPKEPTDKYRIVKIYAPFELLSLTAERMKLKMPLAEIVELKMVGCFQRFMAYFSTETVVNCISAHYEHEKRHLFKGIENEETFFRPALRSLIVQYILTNIPIEIGDEDVEDRTMAAEPPDARTELNNLWANTYLKFQPLWKIRDYFGEKIALYFAVMETLLITLIIPAFLGLAIFIYGLYCSINCYNASSKLDESFREYNYTELCSSPNLISGMVENSVKIISVYSGDFFTIIQSALDNDATPWFGLIVCLWGTIFLELWKRINAKLVYGWDVDNFENDEPTRPEFYGASVKKDPVTGEDEPYYPGTLRRTKMLLSFLVGMLMVFTVIASVIAVVIYKTWARIRIKTSNSFVSFLLTTVGASLLNVVSIIILGKIYHIIAVKMTDWENYRTQTNYNDALILKLFAFHFANSYSSLFYIAFLRKNNQKFFQMIGLPDFEDNCGDLNNCVSELSVQVLILMIFKLCPKLLTDILIPWMKKLKNKIKRNKRLSLPSKNQTMLSAVDNYIIKEYLKPDLGDFTLEEYTEKVIQYGYQMHLVFVVRFLLSNMIPDVPQHIQLAMRKEKYQVATKMKGYPTSLHRFR